MTSPKFSRSPIDLLENVRGIQLTPELARAFAEHAAAGRQIRILTTCQPPPRPAHRPPILMLQMTVEGGLFDRLIDNLDTISDNAEAPITAPLQLERYLSSHEDEAEDDEDWSEPPEPSRELVIEPSDSASRDRTTPEGEEQTPRRWPRRPT